MRNAECQNFVHRTLHRTHIMGKEILRVGSPDLDSPLRLMANSHGAASYVGIDIELGPNAGKIRRVEDLLGNFGPESFDLLICCEMLQHVEDWPLIISIFKRIIRPHGSILITTRSPALLTHNIPGDSNDPPPIARTPGCPTAAPQKPTVFREHELAHALLDGLTGLEIGAAAHNPFGLRTRNVALREGYEFYAESQRRDMGVEAAPVDIWASADQIPVPDASEDFIISSHVLEHLPNVIAAFVEWDRTVRDGGYVFMIVPLKGALPADGYRELTPLAHLIEDCSLRRTLDTHPIVGVPGGRTGHYHTFTPDSLLEVIQWMRINRFCEWELVARENIDRKVGNGFTLAFKVRHTQPRADLTKPNWRYEQSDMEALFSDFEILTLEADPSEQGVFLVAKKPASFQERDLREWPLFSVTANRRVTPKQRKPAASLDDQVKSPQHLYDEPYYESYKSACGIPYGRSGEWLNFFAGIADKIVQEINPRTVLDVGCAKGLLVEALRDRGADAFGLDISEYAISQCREDIRPYCWVASAVDPFPRRYDLIVCIEVLEHLPKRDAEMAVVNLCKHADDILFSSTPDDFTEFTHVNVQPMEYWAGLFAKHGFYRDTDFDATFVAEHATRFHRVSGPVYPIIGAYERSLWLQLREGHALRQFNLALTREKQQLESQLTQATEDRPRLQAQLSEAAEERQRVERQLDTVTQEAARLEGQLTLAAEERQRVDTLLIEAAQETTRLKSEIKERDVRVSRLRVSSEAKDLRIDRLQAELKAIQSSLGWTLLSAFFRVRDRWLSPGSRLRAVYDVIMKSLKVGLSQGFGALCRKVAATVRRKLRPAAPSTPSGTAVGISAKSTPARQWGSRLLMISGSDRDMERYRCYHTQEQLQLCGIHCEVHHVTDAALPHLMPEYDLLILHRVPHSEFIQGIVKTAHSQGQFVLFDIDDLVFDPEVAKSIDAYRSMDQDEQALYMDGVRRYRRTLEICDAALVTTEHLTRAVAMLGKPAWVHRNALSLELIKISEDALQTRERRADKIVIGYASGTRTHNRDFKEAENALEQVLHAHPQVELWIIGHLDLDEHWARWQHRVKRIPFLPWRELPRTLAQLDINLAPLEVGNTFSAGKSELKYLEAAAVGVPTIASKIGAYEFAIRQGENGLLVQHPHEWRQAMEALIANPTLRLAMGERAREDVLQRYHPSARGAEFLLTLDQIYDRLREMSPGPTPQTTDGRRAGAQPKKPRIFKEHEIAHALLDGLTGLEVGAAAHNPFGLRTRNVAPQEGHEFYADFQWREMGVEPARVAIWAYADSIPVPDASEDFVISSHVLEHLPNVITTFIEWDRIVRDGGYVLMIVPLKGVVPENASRELTTLAHFVEDYHHRMTLNTHPTDDVPGGRMGNYHTFTPDSLLEVVEWMRIARLCDWEMVAREDIDSKVGNGFTLAFSVRHSRSSTARAI